MALIPNVRNLHAIFDSNVLATRIKTEKTKNSLLTSSHCSWFQKPRFPNSDLSLFFRWCFLKIITEWVRDHFLKKLYNSGFHQTTLPLATMLSSWWNVLLNRSGSEMVEDVVKVLDHIMKWERVNSHVYSAYNQNMGGWAIQRGGDVHASPTSNRGWVGIRGFSYRVISNKNCSEWSEAPDLAGDAEHSTMARTSAANKNGVADIVVKCGGELK